MKYFLLLLLLSGCKSIEVVNPKPDLPESLLAVCAPLLPLPEGDMSLRDYYLAMNKADAQYAECATKHNRLVEYLLKEQKQ